MITTERNTNEQLATIAFGKQSVVFDSIYSQNAIIQYKRQRVWEHVNKYLEPESSVLELNAGTGEDAVHFAENGHYVHATDISEGMISQLQSKISYQNLGNKVSSEICSFTELEQLHNTGPFDHIFSNFAGLNCTQHLEKVLASFPGLLKPGGFVTLVLLPKFCLWEFLLLFKGKFKTAFRRLYRKKGAKAHIEGEYFRCWYYNPSFIREHLKKSFDIIELEGLCTIVPPSYIENFSEKHPKLFKFLKRKESKWKTRWPWKVVGDYYIITLKRKAGIN